MTTPADDCGVTGGCQACPLFAANVCGDPAPEPRAPVLCNAPMPPAGRVRCDKPAGHNGDRHLSRMFGLGEAAWGYVPTAAENPARFEVDGAGVVTDRDAAEPAPARFEVDGAGVALDLDAPDVDPNEPRPEGAGCCGGGCGA
ncbi:hypothetical protein DER29_0505 [Micromonospora sp. M71_S20]|uniref:hypothetical protein n=1 Tax=Micromonospora sp. M71_S20 TaxID=592872 RepID=UPI000F15FEFB|nr:hypothetical protein [Micromonospora sp. M71_S20]RLK22666.1 hypothetical protein DER29_0505 [Micromonospora sp. M71_S20]